MAPIGESKTCLGHDAEKSQRFPKARRDLSDSLPALQLFVFAHVVAAKPLHTFARQALEIAADIEEFLAALVA
ncbi:hypothetical protein CO654_31135 [Rhizobium sp. L18]|nr:hypothetical protein CO654_31135 [Rhizobium sp. L18]